MTPTVHRSLVWTTVGLSQLLAIYLGSYFGLIAFLICLYWSIKTTDDAPLSLTFRQLGKFTVLALGACLLLGMLVMNIVVSVGAFSYFMAPVLLLFAVVTVVTNWRK